ncbi:hypothetical protein [Amycolatopsis sp. NPDC051102]|uniref:hypothetical protein n=1 Tax=Amycolatopsis sp. NPDC051102 TaxID=3155163 RepID=UPI0034468299
MVFATAAAGTQQTPGLVAHTASIDDAERLTRLLVSAQSDLWRARADAGSRSTEGRPARAHRYADHSKSRAAGGSTGNSEDCRDLAAQPADHLSAVAGAE